MSISHSALCSGMCKSQRKAKLKGKIASKEPLYIIFLSSKWFYVLLVQCFMLLVWWAFFFSLCVYHQLQKFKLILLTTGIWLILLHSVSWHWPLANHSTAIMAFIYCQTQHFWENATKRFCTHLWFHCRTAILAMQICIWFL